MKSSGDVSGAQSKTKKKEQKWCEKFEISRETKTKVLKLLLFCFHVGIIILTSVKMPGGLLVTDW